MPLFEKMLGFFSPEESDSLANKFQGSVSSSYFRRLTISWIFWNWKLFLILFFISDEMFAKVYGPQITRVEWIYSQYTPWKWGLLYIIGGPAVTALLAFIFLEGFNILSFWFTKLSWHLRSNIDGKFNKQTRATNKMVDYYLNDKNKDQITLHQLTNNLNTQEAKNDQLSNNIREHKETINKLTEEIRDLKAKEQELLDEEERKNLTEEAIKAIEAIKRSNNKDAILEEFNSLYKRIKGNQGSFTPSTPSQIRESLVTMKVFNKNQQTNEYTITVLGEEINSQLIMQYN
jgi:hypothetical protein